MKYVLLGATIGGIMGFVLDILFDITRNPESPSFFPIMTILFSLLFGAWTKYVILRVRSP